MVLKHNPNVPMLMGELGKTYLAAGKNRESKIVLEKAMKLSPDNIDRICTLGDLNLREFNTEKAREYFDKALTIDKKNDNAQSGVRLSNNIDDYFRHNDDTSVPSTYAGLLNAIGISLVRAGDYEEGVAHYNSAFVYIEDQKAKAKLAFNVGFAYVRQKKPDDAKSWFDKSLEFWPEYKKAQEHLANLKKSKKLPLANFDEEAGLSANYEDEFEESDIAAVPEGVDDAIAFSEETISSEALEEMDEEFEDEGLEGQDFKFGETIAERESKQKKAHSKIRGSENSIDYLLKECPTLKSLFTRYTHKGIYLGAQIPVLTQLLEQYGAKKLGKAVDMALKNNAISAIKIADFLANNDELADNELENIS